MIIFLLIIFCCVLIGLNIAAIIVIKNQLHKINTYEEWILEFKSNVMYTLDLLKTIDKDGVFSSRVNDKGAFESDDQVGIVFHEILDVVEKLNQRTK